MITAAPTTDPTLVSCLSCGLRGGQANLVEILLTTPTGEQAGMTFCPGCLRDLTDAIHPYRLGANEGVKRYEVIAADRTRQIRTATDLRMSDSVLREYIG
jgi:hypothetical protein